MSYQEARLDAACTEIQSTYDRAYQAQGLRAPARVFGESVTDYELRLAKPLQCHATEIGKGDLQQLRDARLLHVARDDILAGTVAAAKANAGPLRSVTRADATGLARFKDFYGHPGAAWDRFKLPTRFVKRFGPDWPPCF